MVEVNQSDRELVYGLLMPAARSSLQKLALEYIRDGKSDDADAVQQVARHRHQSGRTGAGEALREAARDVIDTAFDYYTARNGRRCSIEGDDGEKCWIVPFDQFETLRRALKNPVIVHPDVSDLQWEDCPYCQRDGSNCIKCSGSGRIAALSQSTAGEDGA